MILDDFRRTSNDRLAAAIRFMLAMVFLMTGTMKLVVPKLAAAWAGQLLAADIPLRTLAQWIVPYVEILVGVLLALGFLARPAAAIVAAIMVVATYVHVVVDDPGLFPLQPSEPVIPIIVMALSAYTLARGAGAWSMDHARVPRT
jgi:uncharacterized membrane protein YphA (DoxX/SURF4 family)